MKGQLEELAEGRPYAPEAYDFVMRGLEYAIHKLELPRHLTGTELLDGLRRFALHEFGPMARHVLEHWGVSASRDFGVIVFVLVDAGVLAKTDEDSIEDFEDGFDFEQVFERDYYLDFTPGS
jgi:uncharacterized repeat protein (TIGR04138 family)